MSFKNMKIRVDATNRKSVEDALLALGHETAPSGRNYYNSAVAFFTYEGCEVFTHAQYSDTFDTHENPEHFLTLGGEFVTADYFKQPATEAFCKGCNPGNCVGCGESAPIEKTWEPLLVKNTPLLPRVEHARRRLLDILHAAIGYVENGESIQCEVVRELDDINTFLAAMYERP